MSEWLRSVDVGKRRTYMVRDVSLYDCCGPLAKHADALAKAAEGLNDPEVEIGGDYGGGVDVEIVGWRDATDEEIAQHVEREQRYEQAQAELRERMAEAARNQPPRQSRQPPFMWPPAFRAIVDAEIQRIESERQ